MMPRWRDVLLEQIRIVGLSLRREALIVGAVLGAGTLLIVSELLAGGPGFDSRETFPTALFSFLIPFAMWRNDKPFGPAFLWTLPVDRRRLALAKVFAGGLWTMAMVGVFISWLFLLALLAHAPALQIVLRVPVIATAATYLFGSAMMLGLRHPLRWLLGAAGVMFLLNNLNLMEAYERFRQPLPILWLGLGLAALWAAASRHKETR